MAHNFPDLRSGDELHPYHINEIYKELRRWRWASGDGSIIVDGANSSAVPPTFRMGPVKSNAATYIQLGGVANTTFGGYAWQAVKWQNALTITDKGSGYSSGNVTFSPTYASGSDAPTATYDVDDNGSVVIVNVTHAGSKMTALTASVSGGTGATLACILNEGALIGGGWVDISGMSGGVGANDVHGNPTPGDLAYEASGVISLGARVADSGGHYWHEATYPAVRDALGRLLFFCRSTILAKTKTISSYPATANVFYGMEPIEISNTTVSEGASGTITSLGTTFYAYNFGTTVPPTGTYVVCGMVSSASGPFFAFRYDA